MQEEVENRTLTLAVSGTKFTGRLLKAAITKYLAHRKEKKLQKQKSRDTPVIPHGKQTVKQLILSLIHICLTLRCAGDGVTAYCRFSDGVG